MAKQGYENNQSGLGKHPDVGVKEWKKKVYSCTSIFFYPQRVLPFSGCGRPQHVALAGLECRRPPASALKVLSLKAGARKSCPSFT